MKLSKTKAKANVHTFLDMATMKFRPVNNLSNKTGSPKPLSITMRMPWGKSQSKTEDEDSKSQTKNKIQFVQKLSQQAFLIGNQFQLDFIIVGKVQNIVVTQCLWELAPSHPIHKIAVDQKKSLLAIVGNTNIYIYKYDLKKMASPSLIYTQIRNKPIKFLQFPSENNLAIFFDDSFEILIIGDQKTRKRMQDTYKFKEAKLQIFLVPIAYQQVMNVFFLQENTNSMTYALHCIEIMVGPTQVEVRQVQKIYDIQRSLAKSLKIDNFSKDVFLMNLGFQILAVRRGYIIDSVNVNIQGPNTTLKFLAPDKLLLITQKKVEFYNFSIDKNSNPHRIVLKPKDSIKIQVPENAQYVATNQCQGQNFIVFYQIQPSKNNIEGQVLYWFTISQPVKLEDKINELFPIDQMDNIKKNQQLLGEKCDMAFKMGLSVKQIFLELWNRTSRSSDQDYQLLLATKSYQTIKYQIQRKLKKSSMTYREVIRIEQACYQMLKEMLFSTHCTEQIIQNFIICHFFNRKLQLYKDIVLYQRKKNNEPDTKIMINIQQYYLYQQCDIKTYVLDHVSQFCFEKKDTILTIRLAIRDFKFVFRVIYESLLSDIIVTSKNELLALLRQIPQFLPYVHTELQQKDDSSLFEGVWPDITRQQWKQSLYFDNITTIDNRTLVQKFTNNIWFKRNWLSKHDLITKSKQNILEIHSRNNSDHIFYIFIAKMFETISDYTVLKEIVQFIQTTYTKLPQNLIGKIFLYDDLFRYLQCRKMLPQNADTFCKFLKLKDYQLFHHFFIGERDRKGLILKQIKPIFQNMGSNNGGKVFNQSLLNYFKSDLSEVSDLKYILNRINNEKKQFHEQNYSMYWVLVQAMLIKLKVGSEYDVPIDEVLIYIDSIPLGQNKLMDHLIFIEQLKDQAQRFRKMKLNMSLNHMIEFPQDVINKMVLYEMQESKIEQIQNWDEFLDITYQSLAAVQMRKEKLFRTEVHYLPFFVYVCKLLQNQKNIEFASRLLNDQHLIENFAVDLETVQNIVIYMYKLKFYENSVYINNERYMLKVISLLPEDNSLRIFLEHEIQFAIMLSCDANKVEYPLTQQESQIPTISQLEQILDQTPAEHILKINLHRLWEVMSKLQMLFYSGSQESQGFITHQNQLTPAKMITQHQVYQAVIMRLIRLRKLRQVIPFIKQILTMEISDTKCNIVYPIIYIIQIANQMNSDSWTYLLRCTCYYFFEPLKLLEILQYLVNNNLSNDQRKYYLKDQADAGKKNNIGFNASNFLFSRNVLSIINNAEIKYDLMSHVESTNRKLDFTKEEFLSNKAYSLILRILCNDPYVLAKYLYIYRFETNWRFIRSFMSYLINEQIFHNLSILEFGIRLFSCMLQAYHQKIPIQVVIGKFLEHSISQSYPCQEFPIEDQLSSKFKKSVEAFKKKKNMTQKDQEKKMKQSSHQENKTDNQIYDELKNKSQKGLEGVPSQYPYEEIDDDDRPNQDSFIKDQFLKSRSKKKKKTFDSQEQMKIMALKKQNNLKMTTGGLYDSYAGSGGITRSLKLSQGFDQKYAKSTYKPNQMTSSHQFGDKLKQEQLPSNQMKISREDSQIILEADSPKVNVGSLARNFKSHPQEYPIKEQKSQADDLNSSQQRVIGQKIYNFPTNIMTQSQQPAQRIENPFNKLEFIPTENQVLKSQELDQEQLHKAHEKANRKKQNIENKYQKNIQDKVEENNDSQIIHPPAIDNGFEVDSSPNIQYKQAFTVIAQKLYEDNMSYLTEKQSKQKVNLSSFEHFQRQGDIQQNIMRILQYIYYHENANFCQVLNFFTQFAKVYPQSKINKNWIEIYSRGQGIHTKYSLDLPIRQLFPMFGLFFDGRLPDQLFNNIKPQIISVLTELNVYKTVKVVSLAFRNSKLEQQMIFSYFKDLIRKHINSENTSAFDQKQMIMLQQKISVLVEKMKPDYLQKRIDQVFVDTERSQAKNILIDIMVESVCKRAPLLKQKMMQKGNALKQ